VKIIHTTGGPKKEGGKEEIIFFYGETAALSWDPDQWWWVDGYHYLDYTTQLGRDSSINIKPITTRR
jgi:hypothetical protein